MSDDSLQVVPEIPPEAEAGIYALAAMSDDAFDQRVELFKKARQRMQALQRSLMKEGTHFGNIPGTDKPTLLKPGSEVLLQPLGLVPRFEHAVSHGDGETSPPIEVVSKCFIHRGSHDGPVVGEGVGAASSWEKKYRYRDAEHTCPECSVSGAVIKGKQEYGGGWLCWAKKGGCGAKFPDGDKRIEKQARGRVDNPDPYELLNTLIKMSEKRAQVDATLRVTATSDLFTQDVEDMADLPPEDQDIRNDAPSEQNKRPPDGTSARPPVDVNNWIAAWPQIAKIYHGLEKKAKADTIGGEGAEVLLKKIEDRGWDRVTVESVLENELGEIKTVEALPRQPKGWSMGRLVLAVLMEHTPRVLEEEPPDGGLFDGEEADHAAA